jgi:hypothetical protein
MTRRPSAKVKPVEIDRPFRDGVAARCAALSLFSSFSSSSSSSFLRLFFLWPTEKKNVTELCPALLLQYSHGYFYFVNDFTKK